MRPFIFKYFHKFTKDKSEGGLVNIPRDKSDYPTSWKNVEFKEYPLNDILKLNNISTSRDLYDLFSERVSDIEKVKFNKVNFDKLSNILLSSCGFNNLDLNRRVYPSAGARYPLEIYLILYKDFENIKSGIYHFNIKNSSLEILNLKNFSVEELAQIQGYDWNENGIICMTSVFDRTARKYGSRGYRYILIEAGHIGQNVLLSGIKNDLVLIPNGSTNDTYIEDLLNVDGARESLVYSISF